MTETPIQDRKFLPWMAGALLLPALVLTGAWLFSTEDAAPAAPAPTPAVSASATAEQPLNAKTANASCYVAMSDEFYRRADMTITGGQAMVSEITLSEPTRLNDAWTYAGVVEYVFVAGGTSTTGTIGMNCTVAGGQLQHEAIATIAR